MVAWKNQMITGPQIRAARALLNWSARDLSKQCGVSHSAIARGEKSDYLPRMQERNLKNMRRAFENHRIEFLDDGGVRIRPL